MDRKLSELFENAFSRFINNELQNILSGVSERNLCGRLSIEINGLLKKYGLSRYFVDTEYNRKQNGEIKTIINEKMEIVTINCDLILHSRGKSVQDDNLIAIEMKKSSRPEYEKVSDKNRLIAMTKSSFDGVWSNDGKAHPEHVCGYKLGVYIELDVNNRFALIEYYRKGERKYLYKEIFPNN